MVIKMKEYINKITCGDSLELLKKTDSNFVDCVITSPPYWGLRDYKKATKIWGGNEFCEHEWGKGIKRHQEAPGKTSMVKQKGLEYTIETCFCNKCGAWKGQFGLEPHPQLYIEHLVDICREIKRVLKPGGSFYLNIGDSYFCSPAGNKYLEDLMSKRNISKGTIEAQFESQRSKSFKPDGKWCQAKQLMLIPSRCAIALQEDGWILRNDILWLKPNPMPCSVTDRLNNTYEHFFFFVKNQEYYYDLDSIREKPKTGTEYVRHASGVKGNEGAVSRQSNEDMANHPLGKNPGDIIRLQEARKKQKEYISKSGGGGGCIPPSDLVNHPLGKNPGDVFEVTVLPFADAHFAVFPPTLVEKPIKSSCPPNGVVLDPFSGSGTTSLVAKQLGRKYMGFDINPDYCEMARARIAKCSVVHDYLEIEVEEESFDDLDWSL